MTILGAVITTIDVVANPRYSHYSPHQVPRTILSSYTFEQKGKYDEDSLKLVNTMKEELDLVSAAWFESTMQVDEPFI